MRVRARVSGLRKHAGKAGYASRYAVANKSVDGARGLERVAVGTGAEVDVRAHQARWRRGRAARLARVQEAHDLGPDRRRAASGGHLRCLA